MTQHPSDRGGVEKLGVVFDGTGDDSVELSDPQQQLLVDRYGYLPDDTVGCSVRHPVGRGCGDEVEQNLEARWDIQFRRRPRLRPPRAGSQLATAALSGCL